MLTKLLSAIRVIGINLLVMLFAFMVLELFAGYWYEPVPRLNGFTCFDPILHHRYCKNVHHVNRLAAEDGGDSISSYIGKSGIPVSSPQEMSHDIQPSDYDIILIGDSYIQADEMPYSQRLGLLLAVKTGSKVLMQGYSSWAPMVETNWLLHQKFRPGQKVLYFVMTNDFTPLYPHSNLNYHSKKVLGRGQVLPYFKPVRADEPLEAPTLSNFEVIKHRSFFFQRLSKLLDFMKTSVPRPQFPLIEQSFATFLGNCQIVQNYIHKEGLENSWIYDYIIFSQPKDCWNPNQLAELKSAVEDINLAYQTLGKQGIQVSVIYIPPGWAFPDENIAGKKMQPFRLAKDSIISTKGLATLLKSELDAKGIAFLDLEYELHEYKKAFGNQQLYFPADGHWNPKGHVVIADLIYNRILKR